MWLVLIKQYWEICLFRRSPADTPYSTFVLVTFALLFYVLILVQWHLVDFKQQHTILIDALSALLLICSYGVYTYALLKTFHFTNRTVQTLTCVLFCHFFVHLCAFPLILVAPIFINANTAGGIGLLMSTLYLLLTLLLTIWQFMLTAFIYKEALNAKYVAGILASIGLLAANILTISILR